MVACLHFAHMVCSAVSHAREVKKSCVSGSKLQGGMFRRSHSFSAKDTCMKPLQKKVPKAIVTRAFLTTSFVWVRYRHVFCRTCFRLVRKLSSSFEVVPTPSPPKRRRLCRRTSASSAVSVASVVAVSPPRRTLAREHSAAEIASDEHDVVRVSPTKNKSDTYRSALGLYTETRAATVSTLPPSPDAEYVDSSTLLATRLWKDGTMTTCSLQAGAKGFATSTSAMG